MTLSSPVKRTVSTEPWYRPHLRYCDTQYYVLWPRNIIWPKMPLELHGANRGSYSPPEQDYTRHTTNDTVTSIAGCLPVSEKVKLFRLRFFGHLARSAPEEDHHRVIAAALRPPPDWPRPPGRPRSTWLRVIDEDVRLQNFGVHTAWRKAKDRDTWHQVVNTATLC